jgi:hypothetical protein
LRTRLSQKTNIDHENTTSKMSKRVTTTTATGPTVPSTGSVPSAKKNDVVFAAEEVHQHPLQDEMLAKLDRAMNQGGGEKFAISASSGRTSTT